MDLSLSTLTGFAAGCIGLYSFMPQVVKCCRTGDVAALSLRMFAVRTFGLLLWTVYGYALGSLPVLIFSALGLVLSSIILVLKVRGSRTQPTSESCRQPHPDRKDKSAAEPITG
ncbi:SemiSWEET family sugar transporter [Microvirga sp. HBU67558]|uniref:SemiSWEET family sugar transporter n=1 Tax=Microvirga TaxID=186650 RepID=UPI001B390962|nr:MULTISPECIES: PQ-loop domain-containing transporter [unclassified Microvirga]MBQ0819805.1 SemiSWEET family sugar transporter [Microvirga sp. HBU67558]